MSVMTGRLGVLLIGAGVALHAQEPTTRRVPVAGGTLAMDEAGRGPVVVFLHGAFLDRGSWDRQVPAVAEQYRVVRYDIRPFGESSLPEQPYLPIDDLEQLLDSLKVESAHLIGHSFGGQVAVDFAIAHPTRVTSLVLVSSGLSGAAMASKEQEEVALVFAAARQSEAKALEAWMRLGLWSSSRKRPEVMAMIERLTARNAHLFRLAQPPFLPTPDAKDKLREISVPALVVIGEHDTAGNRVVAETLAAGIPGARLVALPEADHAIPMGWANALNEIILQFLDSLTRSCARTDRANACAPSDESSLRERGRLPEPRR